MDQTEFDQALRAHDESVSAAGVDITIGMEPTFTRRFAETPEWLSEALGPEKLDHAHKLLAEVCRLHPGGVVLHTLGRQYAGEDRARWSVGYYEAREHQFTWDGPPDPFLGAPAPATTRDTPIGIESFWQALRVQLTAAGWKSSAFTLDGELKYRLLFRCDGKSVLANPADRPQLARASVHKEKIPADGLIDELAENGDFLLSGDLFTADDKCPGQAGIRIELPALPTVEVFVQLLRSITLAARQTAVPSLMMQGFPPPVDSGVAWTTITPDPAVIEVNQAPERTARAFYTRCQLYYKAAIDIGLSPYRLHYNGVVSDSGGGGQFTIGATQPLTSPFFVYPNLLPRLVRYINAHPALSYWFAPPSIGSSSQSPRADEGLRESFRELAVALEQVEKVESPSPEFIWRNLSPFLADPSGNPHRSELNIEKLWNPYLRGRGCLGLVEFRAFRMSRSPECAAAIAVLLRSIILMLIEENRVDSLVVHGTDLHDKYALPFFLQKDLQAVFQDLATSNLPLPALLQSILLQEPLRFLGRAEFHNCYIELHEALEFWPLVGDVASQEQGGSRTIDASTRRLQILVGSAPHDPSQLDGWEVWVDGYQLPLQSEQDRHGLVKLCGLRYRHFLPMIGLHPGIAPRNHIRLLLSHRGLKQALEVTYHEWQPMGLAYDGLPPDMEHAQQRRNERLISRVIPVEEQGRPRQPPAAAVSAYCLDLRRLP